MEIVNIMLKRRVNIYFRMNHKVPLKQWNMCDRYLEVTDLITEIRNTTCSSDELYIYIALRQTVGFAVKEKKYRSMSN